MFELWALAVVLFCVFSLLLGLTGALLLRVIWQHCDELWRLPLALGLGVVFYGALVGGLSLAGISAVAIAWTLRIVALIVVLASVKIGIQTWFVLRPHLLLVGWLFFYYSLSVLSAAAPSGTLADLSAANVRLLTGLPIDNIIAYNFSRYITEGISPSAIEIVPHWSAASRGPLAGILTSAFHLLLGVQETDHWLSTTPTPFLVYHCLMVFLALLVVIPMWSLALEHGRGGAAAWILMMLSTSAFFWINVVFTWPKFLSAFFVILAYVLWFKFRERSAPAVLSGIYLGAAVLAHDLALLYILPFGLLILISAYRSGRRALSTIGGGKHAKWMSIRKVVVPILLLSTSLIATMLPWQIAKSYIGDQSAQRMVYLHLFCVSDVELNTLTFVGTAFEYFKSHSLLEILSVRFQNLWYPFNPIHAGLTFEQMVRQPYSAFARFSSLAFFQYIHALGIPLFALFLWACFASRTTLLRVLALLGISALLPAVLIFGCSESTWNHHWAYPAFALSVVLIADAVEQFGWWGRIFFTVGVGMNLVLMFFSFWMGDEGLFFVITQPGLITAQLVCFSGMMLAIALTLTQLSFGKTFSIPKTGVVDDVF